MTQLHVCGCVFVCKLAVSVPVYTCAPETYSRVPVKISDWCDSLHHMYEGLIFVQPAAW